MMAPPVNTKVRTDTINADMRRLQFTIDRATRQLALADTLHLPDSTPYFSFKTAQTIEDLKGSGLGLRAALRSDIAQGKDLLKQLKAEAAQIRRGDHAAALERQHRTLIKADAAADQHAMRILGNAAKTRGYLTESEFTEVQTGLLKSLKAHSDFVTRNPTRANIKELLGRMAPIYAVGMDDSITTVAAHEALVVATRKLAEKSRDRFLQNPTIGAAAALIQDIAANALVGGEDTADYIGKHVEPTLAEMALAAERKFRQSPSKANCEAMFSAELAWADAGGDMLPDPPKGLRRIKPGSTRVFSRGDTLSGVSKEYYGSFSYWDTIVRANWGVFRDPDVPKVNITINIPH